MVESWKEYGKRVEVEYQEYLKTHYTCPYCGQVFSQDEVCLCEELIEKDRERGIRPLRDVFGE